MLTFDYLCTKVMLIQMVYFNIFLKIQIRFHSCKPPSIYLTSTTLIKNSTHYSMVAYIDTHHDQNNTADRIKVKEQDQCLGQEPGQNP